MIKRVARKELSEMWRDGRFRWAAGIILVLLMAALTLGAKNYYNTKAHRDAAQTLSRDSWINQGSRNPHSAAHFGVYAFKPPMPLSLVDSGLDQFTGVSVWVEAHNQNPAQYKPAEDSTALARFGELNGAFVLQLLIPLLIILLTYGAFASERENGTLRQLLSLGLSPTSLALGKLVGFVIGLGALLLPASVIGVTALALSAEQSWFVWSLPRLLLMIAGYLLYFGIFIGLGLSVSAVARTSRTSLITLLAFWVVTCLLVPRVASDLAERVYAGPTSEEFWAAVHKDIRQGIDGHNPSNIRSEELKRNILARYGVTNEKDLPINLNGLMLNAGEEYGNTVFDKHYGTVWNTRRSQEHIHIASGLIAPFMSVRSFSSGMAGTDLFQYKHFTSAVEQYRRELNRDLNLYFAENSRTADGYGYFAGKELWESTPDFVYQPLTTRTALKQHALPLLMLIVWCGGALTVSVWATKRMKI